MKTSFKKFYIGISLKTSVACGIIILILLTLSSFVGIRLQSNLSSNMINEFVKNETTSLEAESKKLKTLLVKDMTINLAICTGIAQAELFNFDNKRLEKLLANYMQFDNITAIKILDPDNDIFVASWRNPEIEIGDSFPEEIVLDEKRSVFSDAIHQGEKVGSVKIYYSDKLVNKTVEKKKLETRNSISSFSAIAESNINKSAMIQLVVALGIIIALITVDQRAIMTPT